MENREAKGQMKKKATGRGDVAVWGCRAGPRGWHGGSVPSGCGSPGCLLLGKLRHRAGSPRAAGSRCSPPQHPTPGGSPLAWEVSSPSCCGEIPRDGSAGGVGWGGWFHPPLQPLLLLPATAATPAPRPRRHRDHTSTTTTPAPRSRSPPPPLGILQAFNCRKHRLIKQR